MEKEASYYELDPTGQLQCRLCPHQCLITDGQTGRCRVRQRRGDHLISLNYGHVAALALDPVEKKPLYHFFPGSQTLSFAGAGCNFSCRNCQNHSLSQIAAASTRFGTAMSARDIVGMALENGIASISFTYTEPTVFYEMMLECAKSARQAGLKTILVSNGFINPEPLAELIPFLDAANIDLKSFSDEFYQTICGGCLEPVLGTLQRLHAAGVWLEITTLLIPGHNDDPAELDELISFIAALDRQIPWHVSRFFPQFHLDTVPSTPAAQILHLLERAQKLGLQHLYAGNLDQSDRHDTICPQCRTVLIRRSGYRINSRALKKDGCCSVCQTKLAGVFSETAP